MNPYIIGLLFIALLRIWGVRRLWSVAKFHGEEWCFDAPVAPGFYSSDNGSAILRAYRTRMFGALTAEIAVCLIFLAVAGIGGAFWALVVAMMLSSFYTVVTTRRFAKEAWKHALPDRVSAPPKRVVDLAPHFESDYNEPVLVWSMRAGTAAALVMLAVGLARSSDSIDWISQVIGSGRWCWQPWCSCSGENAVWW
jgi:hypothetical protein